jgi:hypothetical protein
MNKPPKTYLIAPLDWGLGHAMRCIPIIRILIEHQQNVILAGSGLSITYLQKEFPHLKVVQLPGVPVSFETDQGFGLKTILLGLKMRRHVSQELRLTEKLVRENEIDVIISDNRYGVRSSSTRNILITHQIYPQTPFPFRVIVNNMVRRQIGEFDQCWAPDYQSENESESGIQRENESENEGATIKLRVAAIEEEQKRKLTLSGSLSHGEDLPENVHFIGPLSRFISRKDPVEKDIDLLAILSGPEPARTDFEVLLKKHLPSLPGNKVLICGREFGPETSEKSIRIIPGLTGLELQNIIDRSKKIICRSGYTTIMDLDILGRSALLVPTPRQSEQEYLAKHLTSQGRFAIIAQSEIPEQLDKKLREIPADRLPNTMSIKKIKWLLNLPDQDKGTI